MKTPLKLLEEIRKDFVNKHDGDPTINRICKTVICEFKLREDQLTTDDYWETRCKLMEQVEENNPCDPDINQKQIDAWSKYRNFIKERGQR